MTTLVCVGRLGAAALLDAAVAVLGEPRDWVALHVVDDAPVAEAAQVIGRLPGRDHARQEAEARMRGMAVHAAAATVAEARAWFDRHGGGETLLRHGRPEQEIVQVAAERRAGLVVLGLDPGRRPGPGRLGHTARFVVDHAQTGVLLPPMP